MNSACELWNDFNYEYFQGGFAARAIFTLPKFDTNTVTTIITQATPHRAPVAAVDSYMVDMYNRVNDYWMSHVNTTLKYVTVLSTGGGFRDVQVPTSLTSLTGVWTLLFMK